MSKVPSTTSATQKRKPARIENTNDPDYVPSPAKNPKLTHNSRAPRKHINGDATTSSRDDDDDDKNPVIWRLKPKCSCPKGHADEKTAQCDSQSGAPQPPLELSAKGGGVAVLAINDSQIHVITLPSSEEAPGCATDPNDSQEGDTHTQNPLIVAEHPKEGVPQDSYSLLGTPATPSIPTQIHSSPVPENPRGPTLKEADSESVIQAIPENVQGVVSVEVYSQPETGSIPENPVAVSVEGFSEPETGSIPENPGVVSVEGFSQPETGTLPENPAVSVVEGFSHPETSTTNVCSQEGVSVEVFSQPESSSMPENPQGAVILDTFSEPETVTTQISCMDQAAEIETNKSSDPKTTDDSPNSNTQGENFDDGVTASEGSTSGSFMILSVETPKKLTSTSKCNICDTTFNSRSAWHQHNETVHTIYIINKKGMEEKRFPCPTCSKQFKSIADLRPHILYHKKENICNYCGKGFAKPGELKKHIVYHHDGVNQCITCKKVFNTEKEYKQHFSLENCSKDLLCPECGNIYATALQLKRHISYKHRDQVECDLCQQMVYKYNLKNHKLYHLGVKEYKCDACEKRFVTKAELNTHNKWAHAMKSHMHCSICNTQFRNRSQMKAHAMIHTGEKPYACDECGDCFRMMSGLKRHMLSHTGEKPFSCFVCGATYVDKGKCMKHVRKQHPDAKPYPCIMCKERFLTRKQLDDHSVSHVEPAPEEPSASATVAPPTYTTVQEAIASIPFTEF